MTLSLKNVGRRVNESWIIRNLDITVKEGECLALLGPSGCGKSSTLRLIAGLDKLTEGSIYISNKEITKLSPDKRKIGMVFQSYALFPHLTIASNLVLGLKVRGISKLEQKKKVSYILSLLQLDSLSNRYPSEISGGQRQRVALARALLRNPSVYLLDEPMSNLDAQLREDLRPELRTLVLESNKPVIYVTHDQQEAMAMANRIAILKDGKLEQIGTPKELYNKPQSIFVSKFIGRPQINFFSYDKNITMGIRPEDIFFDDSGLEAKLKYKEWLGSSQLLILDTPKGEFRMTCNSELTIPSQIKIKWKMNKEHLFDNQTGKRESRYEYEKTRIFKD